MTLERLEQILIELLLYSVTSDEEWAGILAEEWAEIIIEEIEE